MFLGIRTTGKNRAKLYNGTASNTNPYWWFAGAPDYDKWVKEGYTGGSGVEFGNYSWFNQETMWHEFEYTFDFVNRYYTMKVDGNQVVNQLYNDVTNGIGFITKLSGVIEDTQEFQIKDLMFGIKAEEKAEEVTDRYGYLLEEDFSESYSVENTEWNIKSRDGDSVYIASDEGDSYISIYRDKENGLRSLERIFDEVDIKIDDKLKLKFDVYFGKYPQGVSTPDGNKFLGIKAINKTDKSVSYLYDGNTYNKVGYFASAPDYNTWVSLGKPNGYVQGSRVEFVNYDWFNYTDSAWHSFEYDFDFKNRYYTITIDGNSVSNLSYGGTKFLIKDDF